MNIARKFTGVKTPCGVESFFIPQHFSFAVILGEKGNALEYRIVHLSIYREFGNRNAQNYRRSVAHRENGSRKVQNYRRDIVHRELGNQKLRNSR